MKRIIAILLCAVLGLSLLSGCDTGENPYVPTGNGLGGEIPTEPNQSVDTENSFSLPYTAEGGFNPFSCTDETNRVLFSLIYQGLFVVNDAYEPRPILCDTYNISADMKTYTSHIATAYFSDGSRVTASDVQASLQTAQTSAYYSGRLQHVTEIQAYGTTVVMELDTPMDNLPILLDIPVVKAREVEADAPLGTGPYLLDQTSQGIWLRRQAGWWCHANIPVNTDHISLVEKNSPTAIRDAFEFDQINLSLAVPGSTNYVDYHSDYELWDTENGQFLYLVSNAKSKILNTPEILSALSCAINREQLSNQFYHGFALPTALPVSPESPWYTESLAKDYAYDPSKLTEAVSALPEESRTITLLLCSNDYMRVKVGRAIAEMLEECGFTVNISIVTAENFTNQLRWGTYDLYLGQTKLSANMDLSAFFSSSGALSYGGLSSISLYTLCTESLANHGNFYTLHQNVMNEGMLCPILVRSYAIYATRGLLTSLTPARDNVFYYSMGKSMDNAIIKNNQPNAPA